MSLILRFDDHHHYYCRYGRVICCIGVNPDKVYDVTPQTRAQILREMLSGSDDRTRCKNVQVEGMFDALAVKRNAIPLLGKHIQRELMKKIVTSQVQKIYIALDKDAQKDAVKFCEYLMNEGKEVYLVDLEEKDPSEMGFNSITNLIQKTTPLSEYDLMAKKLQFV